MRVQVTQGRILESRDVPTSDVHFNRRQVMTTTETTRVNLRIPGPVPLPDDVLELAGSQMINHRGPKYAEMLDRMTRNLQTVFATTGDVYFITSSGTGSMETGRGQHAVAR